MREFKFLFNKLPFYLVFYPTSRCNARCPHCYNHSRQQLSSPTTELNLEEIDQISKHFGHIKVLTISGGEPFLREDLDKIVEIFYKNNGLQYISFHTNAFFTDKIVSVISTILNKFIDLQVIVCVSIDGIGESHDRFRGVENGFNRAIDTLTKLSKLKKNRKNLSLVTSTIFSRTTSESFLDTINFIKNKLPEVKPTLSFVRGAAKDDCEKIIDITKYQAFFKRSKLHCNNGRSIFSSAALKESLESLVNKIVINNYLNCRQFISCQAGKKLLVVYENGDVYPCEGLSDGLGNLKDVNYDINKLLFTSHSKAIIKKIQKRTCYCTWENIIPVNLLFNPYSYFKIFQEWFRLFLLK